MAANPENSSHGHAEQAKRVWRALRQFVTGAALVALLVSAKTYIEEKTGFGREVKHVIYNVLQWKLATGRAQAPIVTIVDISDIQGVPAIIEGKQELVTPRRPVFDLIEVISRCAPRSIGVDVDFSPVNGKLVTEGDLKFFQDCLKLSERYSPPIPIFLGIKRTEEGPPKAWLYSDEFKGLAATIVVPRKELENDNDSITKMPFWLQAAGSPDKCPSMAAALSGKFKDPSNEKSRFYRELTERNVGTGTVLSEFLVDWSAIEVLAKSSVPEKSIAVYESEESIPEQMREKFAGQIVFLGDITRTSVGDVFLVQEKLEPGVLVHACATQTLHDGALVELTTSGGIILDAALSVLILGAILWACLVYSRSEPGMEVDTHWLHRILTRSAIIAIVVVGYFFVRWTRFMWDDFAFVAVALGVHRPVERCLSSCVGGVVPLLSIIKKWWNKRILRPAGGSG